jgi:1-acyl-sn-glycerol-3-phosphate acyltransferase
MTPTWNSPDPYDPDPPITAMGWLRVALRGIPFGLTTFGCLAIMLVLRPIERLIFGHNRPVTPWLTRFVCTLAFVFMGIKFTRSGTPMTHPGVVVANHSSWLDIFSLNAPQRIYFVSKSEVAGWPGIGWLARATGTVFISRLRADAKSQEAQFQQRLKIGHKLVFFPEGTSTDNQRVLPFKSTLFQALFTPELKDILWAQPVSVVYYAPDGAPQRFYGWWGEMEFGSNLLKLLSASRQGRVDVAFHAPRAVESFANRKDLAIWAEESVRAGMPEAQRSNT